MLPRTAALCDLTILDEAASTNDVLTSRASGAREFTTVLTTSQTSGRGRLGRVWVAEPGDGVAMSVLLRPALSTGRAPLPVERWGWIPLIAGVAMTRAIAALIPEADVSLKWPNDIHVGGLKVSGILTELIDAASDPTADDPALVIGLGVNLETPASRLPTPQSTSLRIAGVALHGDELVDAVAAGWFTEFRELWTELLAEQPGAHPGDHRGAHTTGIRSSVTDVCATISRRVRVELPGGDDLIGLAVGLDETGRLLVRHDGDRSGRATAVAAGDVTHLRYE